MLEMAAVAPVLFALLLTGVDLGIVINQYVAAGEAAQAGAQAAADALTGTPLVLAPAPAATAQQAAVAELQRVAPILASAHPSVSLSWAGPPQSTTIAYPPYTFAVQVTWGQNQTQTVDWTHQDTAPYQEPALVPYQAGQWQAATAQHPGSASDTYWGYVTFPNSAWYPDNTSGWTTWGMLGGGNGPIFGCGAWIWPVIFGCGGGWTWQTLGWGDPRINNMWNYDWWRTTDWSWPGAWSVNAGWPYDQWRTATSAPFYTPDTTTSETWTQETAQGGTQGAAVTVGPYAQMIGMATVQVQAPHPGQTITRRTLQARVTITVHAVSPWLAPFLNGLSITRTGVADAQMAQ